MRVMMSGRRRWMRAALVIVAAIAGPLAVVPAGAVVGTGQAKPQFISANEAIPGTAGNVSLVSHLAPGRTPADATPTGQYSALAIAGNCAYIGRRNYNSLDNVDNGVGVQVVDISDPAAPAYRGTIPGSGFVDSTARELRAVEQYHLLVVLHYSRYTGGGIDAAGQNTGGHNVLQAFHLNPDCSATHLADYDMGPVRPHEFYLWLDPKVPGRVIAYVTTPFGPPQMEVVDFSSCSTVAGALPSACAPALLTIWDGLYPQANSGALANSGLGNYLHSLSVSPDGRTGYMAYWNGGFFTVDTSQVASGATNPVILGTATTSLRDDWSHQNGPTGQGGDAHSAVWIPTDLTRTAVKPYVALSDEDYLGIGDCPFGWLRIDRLDQLAGGVTRATPVSSLGLPENLLTQEAAAVTISSRANSLASDPASCAGYNRDHPGFIGASQAWPGGKVPANAYTSHNPTTLPDLVLLTWYGGGFRVVDIANPDHPTESGYFVPAPEPQVAEELDDAAGQYIGCYYPLTPSAADHSNCTVRQGAAQVPLNYTIHPQVAAWSYPIIKDGLVYFVDNRNGLYVVSYDGVHASEVGRTRFAEGNSNNTAPPLPDKHGPGAGAQRVAGGFSSAGGSSAAAPAAPTAHGAAGGRVSTVAGSPASAHRMPAAAALVAAGILVLVAVGFALRARRTARLL